jgi:hypothetical protein
MKRNWQRNKRERGNELMDLAILLPLILIIIAGASILAPYGKWKIGTRQAAYDCALAASQTLNSGQGNYQGYATAQESLAAFGLAWERSYVQIRGNWERGQSVVCSVRYFPPLDQYPFAKVVNVPSVIESSVVLPVQEYKSRWQQ